MVEEYTPADAKRKLQLKQTEAHEAAERLAKSAIEAMANLDFERAEDNLRLAMSNARTAKNHKRDLAKL